jgi:hypothetical protein
MAVSRQTPDFKSAKNHEKHYFTCLAGYDIQKVGPGDVKKRDFM